MKKYYVVGLLAALSLSTLFAQVIDTDTSSEGSSCVTINNDLSYKNRNRNNKEDVLNLQDFLNSKGYLNSDSLTGFFGRVREKAVIRFQNDNGLIANPAGFVGSGTRAKIKWVSCDTVNQPVTIKPVSYSGELNDSCASGSKFSSVTGAICANGLIFTPNSSVPVVNNQGSSWPYRSIVSASQTSGSGPLTVDFSVSATDSSESSGIYYTIVFGDGQAAGFARIPTLNISHIYATSGVYKATVTRRTGCSSWECLGDSSIVGDVMISVFITESAPTCHTGSFNPVTGIYVPGNCPAGPTDKPRQPVAPPQASFSPITGL